MKKGFHKNGYHKWGVFFHDTKYGKFGVPARVLRLSSHHKTQARAEYLASHRRSGSTYYFVDRVSKHLNKFNRPWE